jgi:7,8-dihydro-6-hydroxymethylpterin-pyrophosphokinase
VDEPDHVIPQPPMHERGLDLVPLAELDADPELPGGRRLSTLRISPDALLGVRPFAPPLPVP